jgi:hypothetical protein
MSTGALLRIVLLALSLGACAPYFFGRADLKERLDLWLEEQAFGKAIDAASSVEPSHPDYTYARSLLPNIRRQAAEFEAQTLSQSRELGAKRQWRQALVLLDDALVKLGDSTPVRKARAELLAQRDRYIDQLRTRTLLAKAQWLRAKTPLDEQIAEIQPSERRAQREVRADHKAINETASQLLDCGRRALARDDFYIAEECLIYADALDSNPAVKQALVELEEKKSRLTSIEPNRARWEDQFQRLQKDLNARRQRLQQELEAKRAQQDRKQQQAVKKKKIRALMSTYEQAIAKGELVKATQQLQQITALDPKNKEVARIRPELDEAISAKVSQNLQKGREQYTGGEVQKALETWLAVQPLAPENHELAENIDRARRVLTKLRELGG